MNKETWRKIEKEFIDKFIKNRDFYLYDPEEERYKVLSFLRQKLEEREKEILGNVKKDLDLMLWRVGHQIKIHRVWLLKQPEKEIIKFVKATAWQVKDKLKQLEK